MMKNRGNSVRTKDKDGYTRRAGCICFKTEQEKEVLLVSSWRHPGRWVVPSGGVEPGEDSKEAAIREVVEEAGVRGTLGRFLGEFQNDVNHTRTSVYVLIVTEELETWQEVFNRCKTRIVSLKNCESNYFLDDDSDVQKKLRAPYGSQTYVPLLTSSHALPLR
ncbi:diphosphoinositol polyphosphate phosphohydrolase 1-like isoform X2 [Montipora foliosa]|uniref:diphosphoinositol polyphosphate phosphohydrolase 1-like isoform X2 n=1 Tax=Montipora foliosa TaxID=591990 RepID=UPI0035F20D56